MLLRLGGARLRDALLQRPHQLWVSRPVDASLGGLSVQLRVKLEATLLKPTSITSLDRGFDEAGALKWGPRPGTIGHVFRRRPAPTPAPAPRPWWHDS